MLTVERRNWDGMTLRDLGSQCSVDSVDRPVVFVLPVISPHTG